MKKKIITSEFLYYENESELDPKDITLLNKAREAAKSAYAPYSGFNVGAALMLDDGTIVTGNNQENVAYPSGLCAERVAIFSAGALYPGKKITSMAVSAFSDHFELNKSVSPCGACRQSVIEYEFRHNVGIRLIMDGHDGSVTIAPTMQDLLPMVFSPDHLKGD